MDANLRALKEKGKNERATLLGIGYLREFCEK